MTKSLVHNENIKSILSRGIEWINVLSTLYLIATLILSFEYQKLAIYLYCISTISDIFINRRYNSKWDKTKISFAIMILFYLCMWIWHIFDECNSSSFFHSADTRLPFLLFGLMGINTNINPNIKLKHVAYTMLATSLIVLGFLFFCNYSAIVNIKSIEELRLLIPIIRFKTLHATHIEFNLYLNCTMAMCFVAIFETKKHATKIALVIGIIILYLSLILNEGRAGFAIANILFLVFYCITIHRYFPKFLIPSLIIGIIIIVTFANGHHRLQIDEIERDPRNAIWNISANIIKEKPIFGHGVCSSREKFIEQCTTNNALDEFWTFWDSQHPNYNKKRFHCHNVFIESTIEFGLVGLILSLLIFLLPIILTKNKRQIYMSLFILIFGVQAMFESFTFHFQIILFCWLIYFILNTKLKED